MSLINFTESSVAQLRAILGNFGDDEVLRLIKSTVPYIESRYFQVSDIVEIEVDGADNQKEYKAFEILPDGTPVEDGIIFDSEKENTYNPSDPIYFDNLRVNDIVFSGSVDVGFAYKVEAVWRELENEDPIYYIIPKGGGGGVEFYYAIFKNHEGNQLYTCDVYPDGLFNSEGTFEEDVLVKVFNVDYGEVLPNAKLKCWPAESNSLGISYYSEAPTWQQDLP